MKNIQKGFSCAALVTLIALGFGTIGNSTALALSCVPLTPEQIIERTDAIFTGKVTSVTAASADVAAHATFEVSEYWKGQVGKRVSVGNIYPWTGYPHTTSYFKVGETYLVFANIHQASANMRKTPNNLNASIDCGPTKLLSQSSDMLALLGTGKAPEEQPITSYSFTRNLSLGMSGEDVRQLQKYLNSNGFVVAASGFGSVGNETAYFGPATKAALIKFQTAHATELGIPVGTGYFGALTRALINR